MADVELSEEEKAALGLTPDAGDESDPSHLTEEEARALGMGQAPAVTTAAKEPEYGVGDAALDALLGFSQGMSLGYGDEIAAAVDPYFTPIANWTQDTLIPKSLGGTGRTWDKYDYVDAGGPRQNLAGELHGRASQSTAGQVGNLAGSLAFGLGSGAALGKAGVGLLGQTGAAVAEGALADVGAQNVGSLSDIEVGRALGSGALAGVVSLGGGLIGRAWTAGLRGARRLIGSDEAVDVAREAVEAAPTPPAYEIGEVPRVLPGDASDARQLALLRDAELRAQEAALAGRQELTSPVPDAPLPQPVTRAPVADYVPPQTPDIAPLPEPMSVHVPDVSPAVSPDEAALSMLAREPALPPRLAVPEAVPIARGRLDVPYTPTRIKGKFGKGFRLDVTPPPDVPPLPYSDVPTGYQLGDVAVRGSIIPAPRVGGRAVPPLETPAYRLGGVEAPTTQAMPRVGGRVPLPDDVPLPVPALPDDVPVPSPYRPARGWSEAFDPYVRPPLAEPALPPPAPVKLPAGNNPFDRATRNVVKRAIAGTAGHLVGGPIGQGVAEIGAELVDTRTLSANMVSALRKKLPTELAIEQMVRGYDARSHGASQAAASLATTAMGRKGYADPPVHTYAVQAVLSNPPPGLNPERLQALTAAIAAGDEARVAAESYKAQLSDPEYRRAIQDQFNVIGGQ